MTQLEQKALLESLAKRWHEILVCNVTFLYNTFKIISHCSTPIIINIYFENV